MCGWLVLGGRHQRNPAVVWLCREANILLILILRVAIYFEFWIFFGRRNVVLAESACYYSSRRTKNKIPPFQTIFRSPQHTHGPLFSLLWFCSVYTQWLTGKRCASVSSFYSSILLRSRIVRHVVSATDFSSFAAKERRTQTAHQSQIDWLAAIDYFYST